MNPVGSIPSEGRLIGRYHGSRPGPCIVLVAGLHGNEPTGILAAQTVLEFLNRNSIPLNGDIHAFRGNLKALELGVRYVDKDLNRIWKREHVDALCNEIPGAELSVEDRELLELLDAIEAAVGTARGDVLIMDLHTSSASGAPFVVDGGGVLLDRVNRMLQVPVVIDTPGYLRGAMLRYFSLHGYASFAFEAGFHGSDESTGIHEAAIWLTLTGLDSVSKENIDRFDRIRRRLDRTQNGVPRTLELVYRHPVNPEDHFRMIPGFRNFDRIMSGQLVGHDRNGEIHSPEAGRIFLPLYQEVGEDGFFIVRNLSGEKE